MKARNLARAVEILFDDECPPESPQRDDVVRLLFVIALAMDQGLMTPEELALIADALPDPKRFGGRGYVDRSTWAGMQIADSKPRQMRFWHRARK